MFRSLFRNKTFLGTLCIVLALIIGFAVVPAYNAQTRKTVRVYRAKTTIYEYQAITKDNLSSLVEQVEVGAYGLPAGAVKDKSALIGKLAKSTIVQSDNILGGQLMTSDENANEFLNQLSAKGEQAASVTMPTLASSLSGRIQTGDVVRVLTFEKAAATQSQSSSSGNGFSNGITGNQSQSDTSADKVPVQYPDLQYLQIVALSAKDGTPVNGLETTTHSSDGKTNIVLPSTVTFACTASQANELAEIEKKNDLYLVFVARGAQAETIIQQQSAQAASGTSSTASSASSAAK